MTDPKKYFKLFDDAYTALCDVESSYELEEQENYEEIQELLEIALLRLEKIYDLWG